MKLTDDMRIERSLAIGYAADRDLRITQNDFQVIDGLLCIDGMHPITWIDNMTSE